jgi:UDP-N-acetylmuramyl pentapeptide phosphotransferase/UDP-N-acetylglucosamine-1-phosphate transferase
VISGLPDVWLLVTGAAIAFATVLVTTPLLIAAAFRWGWLDRPNVRSSHQKVTPRGGGLGILAGTLVAVGSIGRDVLEPSGLTILAGGVTLALVGLWDDRFGLTPWTRLAFHVVAALAVAAGTEGIERFPLPKPLDVPLGIFALPVAMVWIVAVVNFYNFIDGIDGLAGAQAVVTGAGIAIAAWHPSASITGAALAGGAAGFLLFNWSPARIFLGDIGSGYLGFMFATLPFLAPAESRSPAILFVAMSLWLFLADATWTLLRRLIRGERWYEPHREHLYQRLIATGWSHARVTSLIAIGSAVLTALAWMAWKIPGLEVPGQSWGWVALAVALGAFGLEFAIVRWRENGALELASTRRVDA